MPSEQDELHLSLLRFDSKAALLASIESRSASAIVLDNERNPAGSYFELVIHDSGRAISVAIFSWGTGLTPRWLVRNRHVLVGYNDRVAIISLNSNIQKRELVLPALFWDFVESSLPHVCVICEAAITAIDLNGAVVWSVETDLISDYSIAGDSIHMLFADDAPRVIDLASGADQ